MEVNMEQDKGLKRTNITLSQTAGLAKQKDLSSPALELLQVFENMQKYQGDSEQRFDEELEKKRQQHFFPDLDKIVDIYQKNINDGDVCSVLQDNLHLVSGVLRASPSHQEHDKVSDFMYQIGNSVLDNPVSVDNRIKIFSGLGKMASITPVGFDNHSADEHSLAKALNNARGGLFETAVFLSNLKSDEKKAYSDIERYSGAIDSYKKIDYHDAIETLDYIKESNAGPNFKEYFAVRCAHSCREFMCYAKATDIIMDIHKEDPIKGFTSLSHIKPKEDESNLIQMKYETAQQDLINSTIQQINNSKEGDAYSPQNIGKKLYEMSTDYRTYGVGYEGRDFAKSIIERCKDNKELMKAYNKARIESKPLGKIRYFIESKLGKDK